MMTAGGPKAGLYVNPAQAAFRQLHAAHPGAPLTLHVETNKYVKAFSLVLEAGGQRIALTKSAVRIVI